jgi:hypothetical protein
LFSPIYPAFPQVAVVSHDIFGTPGRGLRLREPEKCTKRVIFTAIFFVNGSIIHGNQEEDRRHSSSIHLEGPATRAR